MNHLPPRAGYTLPVFACAAAIAALRCLHQKEMVEEVAVNLLEPAEVVNIAVEQVAPLKENQALAITRSDPGDNLDLTRHTPVWAWVKTTPTTSAEPQLILQGGEGIGRQVNLEGQAAIYSYARRLLQENLRPCLKPGEQVEVTLILPEGRKLAQRTSNAAFGVVEGLSLLGTTGIAQPLSAPGQLEAYQQELAEKAEQFDILVFCLGENGLDLARNLGINSQQLVKTANWLGPMLVAASSLNLNSLLLFGYHGKLIKLAGGIFHTHHHLADGRQEILTAHCARLGLSTTHLEKIFTSPTSEAALQYLRGLDTINKSNWVEQVYGAIGTAIEERSQRYICKHSNKHLTIGAVLFDRQRKIIVKSQSGTTLLEKLCYSSTNINFYKT